MVYIQRLREKDSVNLLFSSPQLYRKCPYGIAKDGPTWTIV